MNEKKNVVQAEFNPIDSIQIHEWKEGKNVELNELNWT